MPAAHREVTLWHHEPEHIMRSAVVPAAETTRNESLNSIIRPKFYSLYTFIVCVDILVYVRSASLVRRDVVAAVLWFLEHRR